MEKQKLITASLLNSITWLQDCPLGWKDKARRDLLGQLTRQPFAPTLEIQRGLDYEKKIYAKMDFPIKAVDEVTAKILAKCQGGKAYQKAQKEIEIDGVKYLIYTKFDVLFSDHIVDIKTTGNYKKGKYLETAQHLLYMYTSDIYDFTYVIAIFEGKESIVPYEYQEESITMQPDFLNESVNQVCREGIAFLKKDPELWAAYEKF